MTNKIADHEKLQLILDLIDRKDIKQTLIERFNKEEQEDMFQMFKGVLADEITFVMTCYEVEAARNNKRSCH